MADNGYDVADPRDVDPRFGTLADADRLIAASHDRGLRITVDVVPNHFSSAHPWFVEALAAEPGSAARDLFLFRDGVGDAPPNNWTSQFGGPAWTRVPDGQWYLHLFAPAQPDLNWRNPLVAQDFETTLRFWLDRGVDGFRIDVAHGLVKAEGLPDNPDGLPPNPMSDTAAPMGMWNQPEVHAVFRRWREILDEYDGDRMLVGEVWLGDAAEQALYVRPDELHLAFNFRLLFSDWNAADMGTAIERSVTELHRVGATPTWVLSNHDVSRHTSRYGGGAVGLARARAALLLILALPGAAYLYQGEELGLEDVDLPDGALRDPIWESSGHTWRGRDGCRVPLPWKGTEPPYAFSTNVDTWLPMPDGWGPLAVHAEPSTLAFYREALRLRPSAPDLTAPLAWNARGPVLDLTIAGAPGLRCLVNLGAETAPLPAGDVVLASGQLTGGLPPDTAVWLALP
jgi:alpha-glucosidase